MYTKDELGWSEAVLLQALKTAHGNTCSSCENMFFVSCPLRFFGGPNAATLLGWLPPSLCVLGQPRAPDLMSGRVHFYVHHDNKLHISVLELLFLGVFLFLLVFFFFLVLLVLLLLLALFLVVLFLFVLSFRTSFVFLLSSILRIAGRPMQCKVKVF